MKVVAVVILALATFGLVALGIVAAQKVPLSSSLVDHVARAGSPGQGKSAPAAQLAPLSPIRDIAASGSATASASAAAPRCIRVRCAGVLNSRSCHTGARRAK
jgi:hypothetical protein